MENESDDISLDLWSPTEEMSEEEIKLDKKKAHTDQ